MGYKLKTLKNKTNVKTSDRENNGLVFIKKDKKLNKAYYKSKRIRDPYTYIPMKPLSVQ